MPTLYDIYKGQGKALPKTVEERFADPAFANSAKSAGITQDMYKVNANNASYNTAIAKGYGGNTPAPAVNTTSPAVTTNTAPTVESTYKTMNLGGTSTLDNQINTLADQQYKDYNAKASSVIDEDSIRKSFKDKIQTSIDAINNTYSSILASAKQKGANNLGMTRAINARSGLLGSDIGAGNESQINQLNLDQEKLIESERLAKINALENEASAGALTQIEKERMAKDKAGTDLMTALLGRKTTVASTGTRLASALLAQGFTNMNQLSPDDKARIANDYGVDEVTLTSEFEKARIAKAKEDDLANKDRYKVLGDGAQLYDTVTGKVIENTKNFAPAKTTGGAGATYNPANPVRDINDAMERIASIESAGSGDYLAVGPATSTGAKAYGRYQVMDYNIPVWTKEVLGKALTVDQFLANPQAQDAVAKAKLQEAFDTYGTWEDSASVWFSGKPLANNVAQDVTGTTVPDYLKKFSGGNTGISAEAQSYIDAIKSGRRSEKEVFDSLGSSATLEPLRTQINLGLNKQSNDSLGSEKTRQTISTIDQTIKELEGMKELSGTFRVRNPSLNFTANANTAFINTVDKLTQQLLRLDGVTLKAIFGPQISNADADTIRQIVGNALNPSMQGPAEFQTSLDDIKAGLESSKKQFNYTGAGDNSPAPASSQIVYQGVRYNVDANGELTPAN